MTLAQWNASAQGQGNTRGAVPFIPTDAHTGRPSGPATGAYVVPDDQTIAHVRTYLFRLDDYIVSSVTGGTIWLIPRA